MTRSEKIIFVADSHDFTSQEWQLVEEVGELLQALNKLHRTPESGIYHNDFLKEMADYHKDFLKEMADVQIMLWQELYLRSFSKKEFFAAIDEKLNREIKRIEGS